MKAKHIVPIVVGGVLGFSGAACSCYEIWRLRQIVSSQNEVLESYKRVIESSDNLIEKKKQYIAVLEQEIVALKEQIAATQKGREGNKAEEGEGGCFTIPEEVLNEPAQSRKDKNTRKEYVFQYDPDFNVVAKYETYADAARGAGLKCQSSVGRAVSGRSVSAAGCFWSKGVRPLKQFPDAWKAAAQALKNEM